MKKPQQESTFLEAIQDHRLLATLVVVAIAVAVGIFLFILGRSAGPPPPTFTTRTDATASAQAQYLETGPASAGNSTSNPGARQVIGQADLNQALAAENATPQMVENTLYMDVNGDGVKEALVLVRRSGSSGPLDVYLYGMQGGGAVKIFERKDIVQGGATFDGPQLVITMDDGDSRTTRTYYTWQNGAISLLKTIQGPPGA